MSREVDSSDTGGGRSWRSGLIALLLLFLILVGIGVWAIRHFDPFFEDRPDFRESKALMLAAQQGPLTDAQFDRAVELLPTAQPAAQYKLVAVLNVEGSRDPARKDRAIAALEGLPESAEEKVRQSARLTADRLKNPPKEP